MTDSDSKPLKTRMRLLITASRIFAEKGFQETTIAEICEQAQSNIASVNYHFRDKESLYLESWRYAFQQDLALYPSDGGVASDAPAEQRLAGRIRSLIARIAAENSHFFAIINKEMAQPTSLLPEILEKEINPQRQAMIAQIKECLGPKADDQDIHFCHASIIGQCFHLMQVKHMKKTYPERRHYPELENPVSYAEHVVLFSLAGIRALRYQIEQSRGDSACAQ
ncbi:MAG: CerR family C-terminal domain-containing protein [Methylicorpusculum sp.]|uniref:CerR family C-terminal domain-containing protein n=1 Tax=Methylicorpusculum sp. TaxID=2713644 RepID=UPI002721864C|nr:CerR family C-terminal domain-containing protein [Methylicorpusculum sp.]MDO8938622.1 CerR family C-terminal domain-containing protein [Methylicorpusculum sp.]MDP2203619.1 CerR family C-terminal domain-containing protein [Methylicorpusculum sp.]